MEIPGSQAPRLFQSHCSIIRLIFLIWINSTAHSLLISLTSLLLMNQFTDNSLNFYPKGTVISMSKMASF